MRWSLLHSSSRLLINDLHGNSTKKERPPSGGDDVNVFQIKQGVATTLCVLLPGIDVACDASHHELWGTQQTKDAWLAANTSGTHRWQPLSPTPELYLFVPQSSALKTEFEAWPSLNVLMPVNGAGYITARDNLVVDFDYDVVVDRVLAFNSSTKNDSALLSACDIAEKKGWDIRRARAQLKDVDIPTRVVKTNYRPFDTRWIFFDSTLVWGRSWPTMRHVVGNSRNLTMLATRMTKDQWDVWVARTASSHKAMSAYDTNSVFPLYLVEESETRPFGLANGSRVNFSAPFQAELALALGLRQTNVHALPAELLPEDVFHYAYAVFRGPAYRARYVEFLRSDFPRLPLPGCLDLFVHLSRLGRELVSLHVMESPRLDQVVRTYAGPKDPEVRRVGWSEDTVWLDAAATKKGHPATPGTIGFRGVPEAVWNFQVGGYKVCEKWLKDRKGRTLTHDDIAHYQMIVVALAETMRLMKEVDAVIEGFGGWPGAFQPGKAN